MNSRSVTAAAVLAALCVHAQAEVQTIAPNFAPNVSGGINGVQPVLVNRNSQVACSYGSGGARTNSFLIAGPDLPSPAILALPANRTTYYFDFSNWGLAVQTDRNGSTPTDMYTAPISASAFTNVQTAPGSGDQSPPTINDSGLAAWAARSTVTTGWNQLYSWSPSQPLTQVPSPSASLNSYASRPAVTNAGSIATIYSTSTAAHHLAQYSGTAWTDTVVERSSGKPILANALGEATYIGTDSTNKFYVELFNGSTTVRVLETTDPLALPAASKRVTSMLADDGSLLSLVEPPIAYRLTADWYCTLREPDGTLVDLQSLLPAGVVEAPVPGYWLNYNGDILLEGKDPTLNTWNYYVYDGRTVTPIVTNIPRAINPVLANNRTMYYYAANGSYYSLMAASIPEPSTLALGGAGVALLLSRRSRSRR